MTPSHKRNKILAIFFLGFVVFTSRESILLGVGNFLIAGDELQRADLIHVLGGDVERIDYGITLYQQDYGGKILFTGGRVEIPLADVTYSHLAREYAQARGIPSESILPFESKATSTFEEVLELHHVLASDTSLQTLLIVSSPFHLRRARWIFEKALPPRVQLRFVPVPFERSRHKQRWWTAELSLQAVVNEYLKIPFYFLKY
ncbi:YdcF family protein [candidate division KSB1 bacterium]|nr:MAG: YdcF family protein [candidate division KSB1 bacterium]MBC6946576.1 YdcF family protein [candidate division KSB1 bacterium]MCE7940171.1 YdcF family protein [Chlorobi bacterium CHB1]MDL1873840.1 YdcF family protein [Cytophagia bacterium CHB2]RIK76540.1 MAG: hypothetical protein DCC62_11225 [candidate division KSB1 bacterium]